MAAAAAYFARSDFLNDPFLIENDGQSISGYIGSPGKHSDYRNKSRETDLASFIDVFPFLSIIFPEIDFGGQPY